MARLTFGGCRPKPGQPCPFCGRPVELQQGRSLITGFAPQDWIVCSGWPHCAYLQLWKPPRRKMAEKKP